MPDQQAHDEPRETTQDAEHDGFVDGHAVTLDQQAVAGPNEHGPDSCDSERRLTAHPGGPAAQQPAAGHPAG